MRSRRPGPEHQEAVARRLAQLSADLTASRAEPKRAEPMSTEQDPDDGEVEGDWWRDHTSERLPVVPPLATPPVADEPPLVPVPGRHASRRRGPSLLDAVPATLLGRVALGPGQVAVVAILVSVGLAVTCLWVVRSDAEKVVAPIATTPATELLALGSPSAAPGVVGVPGASAGAAPQSAPQQVTVDVAGKVRRPGIAVLDGGARVVDALEAAGGARPGVDLSVINLARVLVDGEQILVGLPAPTGTAASAVPTPGASSGPLVNLNIASLAELEELPDVGPVTAQSIIAFRDQNGGFTSVDELLEVDGIGDVTLGKLAPYVTV